jgi:hypothetical protein
MFGAVNSSAWQIATTFVIHTILLGILATVYDQSAHHRQTLSDISQLNKMTITYYCQQDWMHCGPVQSEGCAGLNTH